MLGETNGYSPALCGQYREKVDALERDIVEVIKMAKDAQERVDKILNRLTAAGVSLIVGMIILILQNFFKN